MGGPGSGSKPRVYPPEIVQKAIESYQVGMTVREVQDILPAGYKAQRILERHLAARRPAIPRDQRGELNASWRGDAATYAALHLRVETARGKPSLCSACETTTGRFEWANLTGRYENVHDYIRLCVACHRRFDADRRKKTGRSTRIREVMPNA